jgi:hypothetical protein
MHASQPLCLFALLRLVNSCSCQIETIACRCVIFLIFLSTGVEPVNGGVLQLASSSSCCCTSSSSMLFSCHHSLNHSGECVIFLNLIFAPVVQLHQDSGTPRFDLFLSLMFFIQPTVFASVRRNPSRNVCT